MTLHKIKGDIVFECNSCDATLETGTGNFDAAKNQLRREGWTPIPPDPNEHDVREWTHRCADCRTNPTARRTVSRRS